MPSRPRAPMPGSTARHRASWERSTRPTITSRSPTSSMCGSIPASTDAFPLVENPIEQAWPRASHAESSTPPGCPTSTSLLAPFEAGCWKAAAKPCGEAPRRRRAVGSASCSPRAGPPGDRPVLARQHRRTAERSYDQNGAEILRLWVAKSRISPRICASGPRSSRPMSMPIAACATLIRFLPGQSRRLFDAQRRRLAPGEYAGKLQRRARRGGRRARSARPRWLSPIYDFHKIASSRQCSNSSTSDLSAFYFDIRKNALYCSIRKRRPAAAPRAR